MKQTAFEPEFVDTVPEDLEQGRLYISVRFRTASHLCACGCGRRVVTPIKPPKWKFTYDGKTVSLSPSIGRWQLPCRSHYLIRQNQVVWSRAFSEREIEAVMRRDSRAVKAYYSGGPEPEESEQGSAPKKGLWERLRQRMPRFGSPGS